MKKKPMLSPEEQAELDLKFWREQLQESLINEPTVFYNVGDEVIFGGIKKTTITEILDGGKIYKTHQVVTENNYGNPYDYERDMYVAWHDLIPKTEKTNSIMLIDDVWRNISYQQRDLSGLLSAYRSSHCGIDLDPDYQRGLVWTLEDKQKLLSSIFNCIDIGKFTFIKRPYTYEGKLLEVLDGKQRINAIVEFSEGRFEYLGRTYFTLNNHDRHHFDSYSISWAEIPTVTQKQKYEYFLRLNTGGKPIDQQHIEKVKTLLQNS
jgi:hypothetical protein